MNYKKYKKAYYEIPYFTRTWPENEIEKAPIWCSVDLRDGNQALFSPMTLNEKIEFFKHLVKIGFKEIEVGFPAANETEFNFLRYLADNSLIPDDVTVQVLTQSRKHIIDKTIESLKGVKSAIIHLYNSTSALQRKVVFGKEKQDITDLAVNGAKYIVESVKRLDGNIKFEYSPESFTCTEMEFACEICNNVVSIFKTAATDKIIINLPSSIEVSTPNVYADQVEYMSQNLKNRSDIILSVHPHNDRGTAVAASEMALLAGADRLEGTLFGNGERTGNADISVIALNMFAVGIDPNLDFSNIDETIDLYTKCVKLPIHPRHPYAGELAYTAFSGSHQDAIKKSIDFYKNNKTKFWENPYLTIDPADLNREYEPILINSQSGRGGISYVMENKFGYTIPKSLLAEFSSQIKIISDRKHTVLAPEEILDSFTKLYVNQFNKIKLENYSFSVCDFITYIKAAVIINGTTHNFESEGNGPLNAISNGLSKVLETNFDITSYSEHALEGKSSSNAISYIAINDKDGNIYWGVGIDPSINTSSIYGLLSAINKML